MATPRSDYDVKLKEFELLVEAAYLPLGVKDDGKTIHW